MFDITSKEREQVEQFIASHTECKDSSAIGGQWAYIFVPTSLGPIVKIRCTLCSKEQDCTEYGSW